MSIFDIKKTLLGLLYSIKMIISALFSSLVVIVSLFTVQPAFAQETLSIDPKTKLVAVSASVPDNVPPTTPILISPENNSYVTTDHVTFVWQGSSDANGIGKYELSLDGIIYISDIPPHDAETSEFVVSYDPITDHYTLECKRLIADGSHTWKIRANDTLDNGTDSATWSFTVDTQAPNFILSQVGEAPTSISAQDISTIPANPIELDENSPKLLGHGEANSTVVLTVTIPGDPTQTFTNTTDINGNWGQQLGILPRDVIMILDFTITDRAGLISVLNNIPFIINTSFIVFPPVSPSPTPSPVISPNPGSSPPVATTPPSTPPTSPTPSPLIAIPLTPPIEIAHEIFQETWERLPAPIKALVARVPAESQEYVVATVTNFFPISALLIFIFMSSLALIAMINRFGKSLSPRLIWRTLQALYLLPAGKPQGLVYDSQTHQGISFALIEVRNENDETVDQVVTDKHGIYRGLVLKPGKYQLVVFHPGYHFPTSQIRPANLSVEEFYQGEAFEILEKYAAKNYKLYLIPIDQLPLQPQKRLILGHSNRLSLFIITGILSIIFPSPWNWLVFFYYSTQLLVKAVTWFESPRLTGNVINEAGKPLINAIVAITNPEKQQFESLVQTNKNGVFACYFGRQEVLLPTVIKPGFVWLEGSESNEVRSHQLDTTQKLDYRVIVLVIAPVITPKIAPKTI